MHYLEGLSKTQREAVCSIEGPLLILAGAGAGKTRVIAHRILHLIVKGVSPEEILAVTFTNKAAKEMRERVITLIKHTKELSRPIRENETPTIGTFHALGVYILREHAVRAGIPKHFSIYDRGDSLRAIKEALKRSSFDPKTFDPKKILGAISKQKGKGITALHYQEQAAGEYFKEAVSEVWREYESVLKDAKALDFDDLLLLSMRLLKANPHVLAQYQQRFRYIHIDEYQDTNDVQYQLTRMLAYKSGNICVVGDIDQNIYSWRGASIEHILNFEKNYPKAKTILLEENYRSTKIILNVANEIIKKNVKRKEKQLFTKNQMGEKLSLYGGYDESDESRFVVETVKKLLAQNVPLKEIAVLYRANFQSRVLEEIFLIENVPYQVLGTKFFARKEVKDVLAFVRAGLDPENLAHLKRIINTPPRGIGKVTFLKIAEKKVDTLSPATKKRVDEFFTLLAEIKSRIEKSPPSAVIKYIMRATGIEALYASGDEDDKERLENIKELVTLATKYNHLSGGEGVEKLLEDAALATDQDELSRERDAVRLMTVHAAKGLEFDYVFITGLEEGLFPQEIRVGGRNEEWRDEEEERRLFYVALTRARKKVFLSFASVRMIFGSKEINIPSEFITEIDEAFLEPAEETSGERTIYLDD